MRPFRHHLRLLLTLLVAAAFVSVTWMAEEPAVGAAAGSSTRASAAGHASSAFAANRASRLAATHRLRKARRARLRAGRTLEFGIYPGGGAGSVSPRGEPRPEIASLRQAAIDQLRGGGGRAFVVHLYDAYTQPADAEVVPPWLADQITGYSAAGLRIELVLRYRPLRTTGDVEGFTRFVRSRVAQLGADPRLVSLQVTNEANVEAAPDAADGAYAAAPAALVAGVLAARQEATRLGFAQLAIGFNVADEAVAASLPFFATLRRLGGRPFARAVDWVGIDAYPGTWGPALPRGLGLDAAVRAATRATIDAHRSTLLPAAGLGRTPIVIAESGYPTDASSRTEAQQVTAMRAAIETVAALRRSRGIVGYRWFDLRDANSSVPSMESQYGLMRDDYSPKLGFDAYRALVARFG